MIVTSRQMRSLGWAAVLAVCVSLFAVLSVRVHAVKSEVLLAERKIIALKRESMLLETEFQARASQRQLAEWNTVEFGYSAPRAHQFLDGERQLAALGQPLSPNAPAQIRLARLDSGDDEAGVGGGRSANAMVSPLSGEKVTLASAPRDGDATVMFADAFGDFLIEASPIRAARAQTPALARSVGEASGYRAERQGLGE
jgi:hypothetical protein